MSNGTKKPARKSAPVRKAEQPDVTRRFEDPVVEKAYKRTLSRFGDNLKRLTD